MTRLRVWAPGKRELVLVAGERRFAMQAAGGGWWEVEAPALEPEGSDYGFAVDGEGPFPDPRSRWQPDGVHGRSRTFDPARLGWRAEHWQVAPLSEAVFYELHVGTFTPEGTFDAARGKLDHLVELGVTHVEIMPVNEFPGRRGWGYDGVDLWAAHHAYGGPHALARLVDACHERGLAAVLDVVYNHLGPAGNYLGRFGPYFTDRYATPWGDAVNLDGPESDEVRRFFVENALFWLRDLRFDGLRIDAVHAFLDASARHLLEEMSDDVGRLAESLGRPLFLVAESDLNDPRVVRSPELGGYGVDAQWSDDLHHALHALLTGERSGYYADFGSIGDLARALERVFVYDGRYSSHRRRRHGRPAAGLGGRRFVCALQNHDQIGNRARGERITMLASLERAKVGAALLLTSPFVPLLFQGEEWGASSPFLYFTDHEDPELGRAVREGRRREFASFGWKPEDIPDPQDPATCEASRLDWNELEREPHAALFEWYRSLIRLRRELAWLGTGHPGDVRVRWDEEEGWLAVERGPGTVVANLSAERRRVRLPQGPQGTVHLASEGVARRGDALELPPETVAVHGP